MMGLCNNDLIQLPAKELSMASDKVLQLSDDSFANDVLKSDLPVLVDFWASWCAPCKAIGPVIDGLAEEFAGRVKIAKLNVDENPATPGQYGVRGIPTLILFKDGKVLDQVVGAVPKNQLESLLKKAL
jgi:thioredoxin 1